MIELLQPLPGRVLVQPELPPQESAAGLSLVRDYVIPTTGTIVACGTAKHPLKDEVFDLAKRLDTFSGVMSSSAIDVLTDAAQMLRDLTGREPEVSVGDRVAFSPYVGQELVINETRYLMLREDDVLCVLGDSHE